MRTVRLTNAQARRFLLRHHGLIGPYRFEGKQGVRSYIRQCGCIQYDPIDVCGKNTELVLQSRVKGFKKEMLDALLYGDRLLVDYFDKNLAVIPVEDWPCFAREREKHLLTGLSRDEVESAAERVRALLLEKECLSSRDLDMNEKVSWYWNPTRLSRAILETLYFRGELCVHHKQGTVKFYAPAERLLPASVLSAKDPHPQDDDYRDFMTLRRIGAVGLLWNRSSDAWLGAYGQKDGGRAKAFDSLIRGGKLIEVNVDGIDEPLYALAANGALLDEIEGGEAYAPRMEFIAPLDCLMWDRRLIERLFGFYYRWEIYTPQKDRKFGYYVLPILRGEAFAGRIEAVCDRKRGALVVKNVWWEGRAYAGELRKCARRFARFNECETVEGL